MTELDIVVEWLLSNPRVALRDAHAIYARVADATNHRVCAYERCGQTFVVSDGRVHRKYCDAECTRRATDLAALRRRKLARHG